MKDLSHKQALQRIKAEERRLRRLQTFHKSQALFDRERQMRMLRDARAQAESVESYLATLNPAYSQAADGRKRIKDVVDSTFRGRAAPEEVLRHYPTSYNLMRAAVWN